MKCRKASEINAKHLFKKGSKQKPSETEIKFRNLLKMENLTAHAENHLSFLGKCSITEKIYTLYCTEGWVSFPS